MRSWSIPAGRLFGIELRIHLTFVILLLFVATTDSAANGGPGAARSLVLVAIVFASVVLHELGHAVVARKNGITVRGIILLPIGGITLLDDPERRNPARDIRIAIAGPLVNLMIAAFGFVVIALLFPGVNLFGRSFISAGNLPRTLFWGNVFLGAFNLLPAYPMDGGRILRALFAERVDYVTATRRAVFVGQAFATLFIVIGWLISDWWLVLIALFLFMGAQLEDRSAIFQSVLEQLRMEEVMLTDFATLSPADTLEDALHKAVHSLQDDFPVVRGSDLVGIISRQKILETLRSYGNGYVQAAMNRVMAVAQRHDSLASVFRKVGRRGLTLVPVVDDGRLVGIVTLQNLMHSMALLSETRRLRRAAEE